MGRMLDPIDQQKRSRKDQRPQRQQMASATSNPFPQRRRRNTTATFPLPLLLFCLLLLNNTFQLLPVADAFASYLLSNIGCMTDLSTDEVIMNSQVVSAVDSSHPKVHLALASEQPNDEANLRVEEYTKIYVTPPPPPNDMVVLVDLQLNTEDYADLKDVQFVVDVEGSDEDGDTTTSRASLINGQCDDSKRVAARGHDTVILKLSIDDATATAPVRVWAGWATGHEAVRLTPVLEFHIISSSGHNNKNDTPKSDESDNHENNHEDQQDGEEHKVRPSLNAYKHHKDGEVKHKEPPNSRSNKSAEENSNNDHRKEKANDHDNQESSKTRKKAASSGRGRRSKSSGRATRGDDDSETSRKKKRKSNPRSDLIIQQRQRKTLDDIKKTQQQNNVNNKKEAGIDIDTTWFLYGLGILVVGNLLVVQVCTYMTGGRGGSTKGRLSL